MANRYWVRGAGTWNATNTANWSATSGGPPGASAPTSADVAYFDGNSGGTFTVTVNNASCYYFHVNVSGITFNRTGYLTVYGNIDTLLLTTPMTGGGQLRLVGSGGVLVGANVGNVTISGTYTAFFGSHLYATNLNITGSYTTGGDITCSILTVSSGGTLSFSSAFRQVYASSAIQIDPAATISLSSTSLHMTGDSVSISAGGKSLPSVYIDSTTYLTANTVTISNCPSISALVIAVNSAPAIRRIKFDNNIMITSISVPGTANNYQRVLLESDSVITMSVTTNNLRANTDFRNISAQGSAWDFSTDGGDHGGNSNITFPAPRTVYRNSSGVWIDGSARWSLTSGGTADLANNPRAQDTAVIDNAGTATTVVLNGFFVKELDASSRTSACAISSSSNQHLYVLGDYSTGSGVTYTTTARVTLSGSSMGSSVSIANAMQGILTVSKPDGSVQADSDLEVGTLAVALGEFSQNGWDVSAGSVTISGAYDFSGGELEITGVAGTLANISPAATLKGNARITLSGSHTGSTTFNGGGKHYDKLVIAGSGNMSGTNMTPLITGDNSFNELSSTRTTSWRLGFANGSTQMIGTFGISGSAGNPVVIRSNTNGQKHNLLKSGGVVSADYLDIRDSDARPFMTWYAGDNSTDSGNNSGWTFSDPVPRSENNFLIFF